MRQSNISSKSAGTGLLVAVTASLCCITPVLALISGTSGIAASFSWMEPFRPYLIGLTVLVLVFAWFQKLKPKVVEADCTCEEDYKKPFLQSQMFLGMVTLFATIMLAFPYYSFVFYPDIEKEKSIIIGTTLNEVSLSIEGMTCTGCEEGIEHATMKLPGVMESNANYADGSAIIKFNQSTSTEQDIIDAINATGYRVVSSSTESQ